MCADTFFVDEDCTFAQRGVVLVYIAVLSRYCADSGPDVQKSVVVPQMQSLDKFWICQLLC